MNGNLLSIGSLPGQGPAPPLPAPLEDVRVRALAGDGSAARYLGDCYREGDPLPFSPLRAFRWYVRGAFAGDADAMNNLGACYHNAVGCRKAMQQAIHWYARGACRDSAHAQENLGRCYLLGDGVAADRCRGIYWLRQAARQGHAKAIERLKEMGVVGLGPELDQLAVVAGPAARLEATVPERVSVIDSVPSAAVRAVRCLRAPEPY